jgi:catechol 2,3-dioxygenase-like lactoylglutathione lyase family enzyme
MSVRVESLDHVNIITADLEGTAGFYAELFGLEPRDGPPPLTHANARWMYDEAGRAILHINSLDCPRTYQREVHPGPTGALHHVALRCAGYEEMRQRLRSRLLEHQLNEVPAVGLRQIFTLDPNGVLLELNFFGA